MTLYVFLFTGMYPDYSYYRGVFLFTGKIGDTPVVRPVRL